MCLKRLRLFLVLLLALGLPFSAFCSDTEPLTQADLTLMTRAELEQIVLIYDQALISSQAELEQNKQNWLNLPPLLQTVQDTQAQQAQTLKTLSQQLEQSETEQKSVKIQTLIDKAVLVVTTAGITALIYEIKD